MRVYMREIQKSVDSGGEHQLQLMSLQRKQNLYGA